MASRDRGPVVEVDALVEAPPGEGAVHRAGVEVAHAEVVATARATVDLPEPDGPSMATTMSPQASAGVLIEVTYRAASVMDAPAPVLERGQQPLDGAGQHGHLGQPERLAQAVVEVELLEVDARPRPCR